MPIKCPNCHFENLDDTVFCRKCGTKISSSDEIAVSHTETLQTPLIGLTKGRTIAGRYEIIEELGEGGMGVVYRARDVKLKRTVALKFLSPALIRDSEAKERFIHEAQAASALDHPNICTVHEIDEAEGLIFIAMACIEGQSLKKKVESSPLNLEEALNLAYQVAEGLYEAHEKGIVHRDIKSANIMVDAKNQAKIMDFGIAKLAGQTRFTQTGTTMGTVAYMSPEQARGKKVDHRTDIWSLGVVLYEMVIGQLPFKGEHEQAIVYSILNEEPEPMTGLRTGVPMELERIVRKAIAKNPDERYQHANEMRVDLKTLKNNLDTALKAPGTVGTIALKRKAAIWQRPAFWMITAVALAAVVVVVFWKGLRPEREQFQPPTRFTQAFSKDQKLQLVGFFASSVALSPDGAKLVYVARGEEAVQLYLRRLDEFDAKPIPGTEWAFAPFFSPDGSWIGFQVGGRLKKVSLRGGTPIDLCNLEVACFGGNWPLNDTLYFSDCSTGLKRVSSSGGTAEVITQVLVNPSKRIDRQHQFPQLLPGGKAILFTIHNHPGDMSIAVHNLETKEQRILIEQGTHARYVSTGHLIYAWAGDLLAVPFDVKKLEVTGSPIPIVKGVLMEEKRGAAHFSVSENGTLVYLPGGVVKDETSFVWVDSEGNIEPFPFAVRPRYSPRISPDGTHLSVSCFAMEGGRPEIRVYGIERGTMRRLTDNKGDDYWAIWTLDSTRVIFNSNRDGGVWNLYWKPHDGSSPDERLIKSEFDQQPQSLSPDGKVLAFTQMRFRIPTETKIDIWMLPLDGNRTPSPFVQTRFNDIHPSFSPDGHWLAYASNESNRYEVYVKPYPGPGGSTQVSTEGGCEPVWSPDGKEIFYRSWNGSNLTARSFQSKPIIRVGNPRVLFTQPFLGGNVYGRLYDLSPDDQRFLMIKSSEPPPPTTQLNVIINWFEELKRLVPSGK